MIITFYKVRPKDHPFPIIAWLIMIFQGMNPFNKNAYSHMAIGYESEADNSKIADVTSKKGCSDVIESRFFNHYKIVDFKKREFNITRKQFLSWFERYEGLKYDKIQLAGLFLKVLGIIGFNKTGANFNRLICSELILSFLVEFDNLEVRDSDNWDLNMTWDRI